jgi:hypothetical protein
LDAKNPPQGVIIASEFTVDAHHLMAATSAVNVDATIAAHVPAVTVNMPDVAVHVPHITVDVSVSNFDSGHSHSF